jgi:structural maintenance of chromosome 4
VAVSTACPGLDNLVCSTVETGQACLEHLRRGNLGRATILCLNALAPRDLKPIETPENAPRLFDLVEPKEPKFAAGFYQVLQNTLVAKDLAQANRIAFGKRRWRVVTLDGMLIDTSGTMSGGGNRVAKGAMGSRFATDEVGSEVVARMERERDGADAKLRTLFQERQEAEAELASLQKRLPETQMEISKIEMDVQTGVKRVEEGKRRIKELRSVLL